MQTPNKQQNWKKNIARPESGVEATSKPKFFEVKDRQNCVLSLTGPLKQNTRTFAWHWTRSNSISLK